MARSNAGLIPEGGWAALKQLFRSPDLRRALPWLLLASLFANLLALALPLAILQILDRVLRNQSVETLLFLTLGVLLALFLEQLLRWVNGSITNWLAARFKHQAGCSALQTLLNIPLERYRREPPAKHMERLQSIGQVADFYSGQAILVLFDLPFVLLFLFLVYLVGGVLVWVPAILIVVFFLGILFFGKSMRRLTQSGSDSEELRMGFLHELLSGVTSVKTMMMEPVILRRYETLKAKGAQHSQSVAHGHAMASGLGVLLAQIMVVAVVFGGAWLVTAGTMTPGSLAACMMLSVRALQPLRKGLSVWIKFQSFFSAQKKLQGLLGTNPSAKDRRRKALPVLRQALQLHHLTLNDSAGRPLLSNLSLQVRKGECIALSGNSGVGKSRLLSVCCGLETAEAGRVYYDDQPLSTFDPDSVFQRVALLPQAAVLVEGTILDNLTFFAEERREAALLLAERLGLSDMVARLRHGYETRVEDNGGENIPSGVRQLITIVRALLPSPDIILFDEANIALDRARDQQLWQYLSEIKGHTTIILVSHRPSYLRLADRGYCIADRSLSPQSIESLLQGLNQGVSGESAELADRPNSVHNFAVLQKRLDNRSSDLSRCILPLLKALKWRGKPLNFVQFWPHRDANPDLSSVLSFISNLGFEPVNLGITDSHIDRDLYPCLFVPAAAPALVLLDRNTDGSMQVYHSQHNATVELPRLPSKGMVFTFEDKRQHEERAPENWVADLFWKFRKHILLAFVVTFLGTLLSLAPPLFVRSFYDAVLPTGEIGDGVYLLLGVSLAILLSWLMTRLKSRILAFIGGRIEYILGSQVLQQILSLPAHAIAGGSVSRQVQRIKTLERTRDLAMGPLALVALELPANLLILGVLAVINPWGAGMLVIAAVLFALMTLAVRQSSQRAVKEGSKNSTRQTTFVDECLETMTTIRGAGHRNNWHDRFRKLSGGQCLSEFREQQTQLKIGELAQFVGGATGISVLSVTAYFSMNGSLTGGTLMATMMLTWRLVSPMQSLFLSMNSWTRLRTSIEQVNRLMRLRREDETPFLQSYRQAFRGELELARVSYRYGTDTDAALENISFRLDPGEMLGIAGPSGSGKSTLLKLIAQVYSPQSGTIKLDNINTAQLPINEVRAEVSYMPQRCQIMQGTIDENLRCAFPPASTAELRWASKMAGLDKDIQQLPQGYDTELDAHAAMRLPYGFRQRLSLARTLLKPAKVVLLDEPGTGMDAAGDAALQRCMRLMQGYAVVIVVSHRPAHLKMASQILYLEEGKMLAMGSFADMQEKLKEGMG